MLNWRSARESANVTRHLERAKKFPTAKSLGSRSQVHAMVTRHNSSRRGMADRVTIRHSQPNSATEPVKRA